MLAEAWRFFKQGKWNTEINVRDFIQLNYCPYNGNEDFLQKATSKTKNLLNKLVTLQQKEQKQGVLDIDLANLSGINNFSAGYLDKQNELIVGLQTDTALKRMINAYGGVRMVKSALIAYGYTDKNNLLKNFSKYRKSHNDGVFDVYSPLTRKARSVGLLTGLPDAYGRGRIIGDYRRIALYGLDYLIGEKLTNFNLITSPMNEFNIRLKEEITEQIKALRAIKEMALKYKIDISKPATNAQDAIQYLYFGYLAAVKENNGAAMSLGRVSTFLDIYIERDLAQELIREEYAQELIDQFVLKLRAIRHLRTPEYNELFAGDPNWITESIGGIGLDGRHLITKTSYRFIHSLTNLAAAPEPNITVLWAKQLPVNFKQYCCSMSIKTSSIQYENDDIMRPIYGDDYAIACCISAMKIGKEMQFFGARCNIAKALLYAINGGVDEKTGEKIIDGISNLSNNSLKYEDVLRNYKKVLAKVAKIYVDTMNIIHYMHDKYAYEASQMALHDIDINRYMAFGVAGLSIVADSLSAIKYAQVTAITKNNIAVDFEVKGSFPTYGNDDDRVDFIAKEILELFIKELRKHKTYRDAKHTLSVLTITSNIVYGKKTGSTPDGRKLGEPFAPGANPMHGRDNSGALASLNSVAKLSYKGVCEDGISNTFTIVPQAIGKKLRHQIANLQAILDGYFSLKGHHLNVNVIDRDILQDAMDNPQKYPNLTIRVSGYAVKFNRLTHEQQMDIIKRTFHSKM